MHSLRAIWIAVALLISLDCTAAEGGLPSAEEVVRTTANSAIEKLHVEKANLEAHPERLYELIQELVVPHFDFPIMSRWVLGRAWNQADEASQQAFIEQFKTLLVRTYAKALMEYSNQELVFLPVENDPSSNLVVVKTEVSGNGGGNAIPINYRMHVSGGRWMVIDISVDGVSLIGTYRGSFASEIRKNGLDALIRKMTERNDRLVNPVSQNQ